MTTSRIDRVPILLGSIGAVAIAMALFLRPAPLPAGVARFAKWKTIMPDRALAGRSYALDVIISGDRHFPITGSPVIVPAGQTITISGWALDWRTMKPGKAVLAALDGGTPRPVTDAAIPRPDVVNVLHDPDAATSGFHARISLAGLAPGLHHLAFSVVDARGRTTMLPTDVPIMVQQP